ncbi:hypothetical protein [uncultured Shewanella sp.]|uniref:hypothetical protein n=1 Tax=uncultured Shewanella sp. TaxID=173975 RepID=UPI00261132F4|nr:hypothetical protein [uncultured Shewanella sp.]
MSVLKLVFIFGAIAFSAISTANEAAPYSMSQHDFSKTSEVSAHYDFALNPPESGAITDMGNQDFPKSQHDLSQTYATSSVYDFENNPEAKAQLVDDKITPFKQSQHDKSMSDF